MAVMQLLFRQMTPASTDQHSNRVFVQNNWLLASMIAHAAMLRQNPKHMETVLCHDSSRNVDFVILQMLLVSVQMHIKFNLSP